MVLYSTEQGLQTEYIVALAGALLKPAKEDGYSASPKQNKVGLNTVLPGISASNGKFPH